MPSRAGGFVAYWAGGVGDLLLQARETDLEVAASLLDRQQVARLGIEDEEQSVKQRQSSAEDGIEGILRKIARARAMHEIDESFGEQRKDILEDAALEVLAEFARVFLALIQNAVNQRKRGFAPLADDCAGHERIAAKQQPEIAEGVTGLGGTGSLIGEQVRQIDLVIVGRARMGAARIEPPQTPVRHDHPRGVAAFEQTDHLRAGVRVGRGAVAAVVLGIEHPVPRIGEAQRQRRGIGLVLRIEQVTRAVGIIAANRVESQGSKDRLEKLAADCRPALASESCGGSRVELAQTAPRGLGVLIPLGKLAQPLAQSNGRRKARDC